MPDGPTLRSAAFAELDAATLYAILQLRFDVFVLEQRCVYRELDGRDTEPTTLHVWTSDGGVIGAYLRVLRTGGEPARIGRVVTTPAWRGRGVATRLVRAAIDLVDGPVVLDAQAHLRTWYERRGFAVCGPEFVDAGIAHVPMALTTR